MTSFVASLSTDLDSIVESFPANATATDRSLRRINSKRKCLSNFMLGNRQVARTLGSLSRYVLLRFAHVRRNRSGLTTSRTREMEANGELLSFLLVDMIFLNGFT